MSDLLERLTSRKFLLTVLGILIAIGQTALGTITSDQALDAIKTLIVAYIGAEGIADALGRYKPAAKTDPVPAPAEPPTPT